MEAAKLLNADPEEIALVESTSHGLNIAAQGIELNDGDNIVTTNLEFIQVALPWCVIRKEKNIDIRVCKPADERFTAAAFEPLVDDKTRVLVMSTLEWCNGWQSDMKEIGDFCKERGIYLVVDAVQQLGVTKIDTKACHIDILTAGGHKWLNSPYGTGVLYVNKETLPKLKQSYAGYLNTTVPEGGWGAYWENPAAPSVHDWTFPMTARRFEIGGTSNYTGAIALGESLGLVNEIGIENIEAHVRELASYCMDRIEEIGGTLITHRDPGHFGGIVIARLYDDLDTDRMILTAMATGAVDYIVKGAEDEEVLAHIRAAAAGHPMLNARVQSTVIREYDRLRRSEQSLLFFINNVSQLTSAERELVRLLLQDKKVKEIAAIRCVEVVTVKTQIKGLLHKFGCTRTKEIVEMIRQLNISHLF